MTGSRGPEADWRAWERKAELFDPTKELQKVSEAFYGDTQYMTDSFM